MSAAFIDMDRTLLDVNSGRLWLQAEWRSGRLGGRELLTGAWWLMRYTLGDDDLEHALHAAAALYEGTSEASMRQTTLSWFDADVAPHLRPGAMAAMQAHRDRGDRIVLATSSSQFAAGCARDRWGFDDVVCTHLQVEDGVLTGRIDKLGFGSHKLTQCERWAASQAISLQACAFYTDSYSDLPLLEKVGRPFIVAPDRRLRREAHRRHWPVVSWDTAPP